MTSPKGLVVVGASAGGVEALQAFVRGLPADLSAAVCVVLHIPRSGVSALPQILDRCGPLPAQAATDGAALDAGQIYVAPPNVHLLIDDYRLRLSRGPTENGHRPAVDPLFRSAARVWGAAVIGVVLSGSRDDGSYGLSVIARRGGVAIVQDPAEALYPSMPTRAAEQVPSALSLPAAQMGSTVAGLLPDLRGPAPARTRLSAVTSATGSHSSATGSHSSATGSQDAARSLDLAEDAMAMMDDLTADEIGAKPAGFGCPSCNGALFELPGEGPRFRCRVGHAWSGAGLLDEQAGALEGALWTALRSLEEKASLGRRMAGSAARRGNTSTAARYADMSREADHAGHTIRKLIEQLGAIEDSTAVDEAS